MLNVSTAHCASVWLDWCGNPFPKPTRCTPSSSHFSSTPTIVQKSPLEPIPKFAMSYGSTNCCRCWAQRPLRISGRELRRADGGVAAFSTPVKSGHWCGSTIRSRKSKSPVRTSFPTYRHVSPTRLIQKALDERGLDFDLARNIKEHSLSLRPGTHALRQNSGGSDRLSGKCISLERRRWSGNMDI